jgi:hypothetical protein
LLLKFPKLDQGEASCCAGLPDLEVGNLSGRWNELILLFCLLVMDHGLLGDRLLIPIRLNVGLLFLDFLFCLLSFNNLLSGEL